MANWRPTNITYAADDDADDAAREIKANPFLKVGVRGRRVRIRPLNEDRDEDRPYARASAWEHWRVMKEGDGVGATSEGGDGWEPRMRKWEKKKSPLWQVETVREKGKRVRKVWGPRSWTRERRVGGRLVRI